MIELKGSLGGIGLPAVIKLLTELEETGILRLREGGWNGELAFQNGELISATVGNTVGLDALTACVLMLGNSEFTFLEASADVERNITLGSDALGRFLTDLPTTSDVPHPPVPSLDVVPQPVTSSADTQEQLTLERTAVQVLLLVDGERTVREIIADRPIVPVLRSLATLAQHGLIQIDAATSRRPVAQLTVAQEPVSHALATQPTDGGILATCPMLGYADDRDRHYSRPTAMHRCYATAAPSLVSSQEQRDLCFGGRYSTCPRFVNAETPAPIERAVPPGVVARMSVASQSMKLATLRPADDEVPGWIGTDDAEKIPVRRRPVIRARWPLLLGSGALTGVFAIALVLFVLMPMLRPALVPAPLPTPVTLPTTSPTSPPVVQAATSLPKPTLAPTTPPRAPTPTPPPAVRNVLVDTRFAAGAQKEWLENPPFAGWRDGAYRLSARQSTRFVAVAAPLSVPDDVVISATLRKTGGPPGGGYGVIVRNQAAESLNGTNQNFEAYVLETGDLGEFGIWRREGDHWVDLVPWTRSQAVRQGGSPNELTVRATGTVLTFTINGIEVARVDDDALTHGGVGVFAGGDNNEVALDRFTVQIPN